MDEKDWPSIHKPKNKPNKTDLKKYWTKDGWKLWPLVPKAKKKIKTLKINV